MGLQVGSPINFGGLKHHWPDFFSFHFSKQPDYSCDLKYCTTYYQAKARRLPKIIWFAHNTKKYSIQLKSKGRWGERSVVADVTEVSSCPSGV